MIDLFLCALQKVVCADKSGTVLMISVYLVIPPQRFLGWDELSEVKKFWMRHLYRPTHEYHSTFLMLESKRQQHTYNLFIHWNIKVIFIQKSVYDTVRFFQFSISKCLSSLSLKWVRNVSIFEMVLKKIHKKYRNHDQIEIGLLFKCRGLLPHTRYIYIFDDNGSMRFW